MNKVLDAIKRGWHKTSNDKMKNQNWSMFQSEIQGKKIYLFGVGNGIKFFLEGPFSNIKVEGVIDNDTRKQGVSLTRFLDAYEGLDITISSPEVLRQQDIDRIVVLITSLRYYEEIGEQLEKLGIVNYFGLLPMEAQRYKDNSNNYDVEEQDAIKYDILPIQKNKIVFCTMGNFSGHGKAIAIQLQKIRKDLDIVWAVNSMKIEEPKGIRFVYIKSKKFLYEMTTAKMWIYDISVPEYIIKREGQIYIQTKHWSSITLKTFGLNVTTFRKNSSASEAFIKDGERIDYLFTGSKFDTETCRKGFGYVGKVVEIGSARSDILFRSGKVRNQILERYNLTQNDKIILYAPTFRIGDNGRHGFLIAELDYLQLLTEVKKYFGGEWKILVRFHPNVLERLDKRDVNENIIDVTDYHDGQELVAAADIVITDYSSIMFEPAFVKKPVFLFAPDRNEYINGERELLIPYDTLPFPIAETNEQLAENVASFNQEEYEEKVTQFLDAYGVHEDGYASERAADVILGLLEKEQ